MPTDFEFLRQVKRDRRLKRSLQFYKAGTMKLERLREVANRTWELDKQDAVQEFERLLKVK